jgi:hypothetical protein
MGSLLQFQGRGHPIHGFGFRRDPDGYQHNKFFLHPASSLSVVALLNRTTAGDKVARHSDATG